MNFGAYFGASMTGSTGLNFVGGSFSEIKFRCELQILSMSLSMSLNTVSSQATGRNISFTESLVIDSNRERFDHKQQFSVSSQNDLQTNIFTLQAFPPHNWEDSVWKRSMFRLHSSINSMQVLSSSKTCEFILIFTFFSLVSTLKESDRSASFTRQYSLRSERSLSAFLTFLASASTFSAVVPRDVQKASSLSFFFESPPQFRSKFWFWIFVLCCSNICFVRKRIYCAISCAPSFTLLIEYHELITTQINPIYIMAALKVLREMIADPHHEKSEFQAILLKAEYNKNDASLLLRKAAECRQPDFGYYLELLVKHGADVNFHDSKESMNILMIVCRDGTAEMVQHLLKRPEIDLNKLDARNRTAAFYTLQNKKKQESERILRLLLDREPNLVNQEASNQTLLILAIEKHRLELVKLLIEKGANSNQCTPDTKNTPLHHAVKMLKSKPTAITRDIIRLLLQNKADCLIRNKQEKNVYQYAERCEAELRTIEESLKENKPKYQQATPDPKQTKVSKPPPFMCLNTKEDILAVLTTAEGIFRSEKRRVGIVDSESEEEDSVEDKNQSFVFESEIIEKLDIQIRDFEKACLKDYNDMKQELQPIFDKLEDLARRQKYRLQTYGSFATGLWLKNCDINLVLVPETDDAFSEDSFKRLQNFQSCIRKSSIQFKCTSIIKLMRISLLRLEVSLGLNRVKRIQIAIYDRCNNGLKICEFVKLQMQEYPLLQPLLLVLKNLTTSYRLNDHKKGGMRTYAIIIMLLFLLARGAEHNSGKVLIDFLYYFGYFYNYSYTTIQNDSDIHYETDVMYINVLDPLQPTKNVGQEVRAFEFQSMCRAAYIALHANIKFKRLIYLFDTRKIIINP